MQNKEKMMCNRKHGRETKMESADPCSSAPHLSDLMWDPLRDGSHVSALLWCQKRYIRERKARKKWVTKFPGIPFQSHMPTRCSIPFPSRPSLTIWVLQHLHSISADLKLLGCATQHSQILKFQKTHWQDSASVQAWNEPFSLKLPTL